MSFETASVQWEAGVRALEASAFDERPILEKVTRLVAGFVGVEVGPVTGERVR